MNRYSYFIFFLFITLFALPSCEKSEIYDPNTTLLYPDAVQGEVRLVLNDGGTRASYDGMTRAMLASDGKTFLWQTGDRFRLYARTGDGSNGFPEVNNTSVDYVDFSYWVNTTTYGRSFFRGQLGADMADADYSYYAVFPRETAVEGTVATFNVPAVQSGEYNPSLDFMYARSSARALQRITDNDKDTPEHFNDINLILKHQLHALRFTVPNLGVLTSGVRRVHILFSEPVVGNISVNMANDEVSYTDTSNKVTIDFGEDNEMQAGDTFWVMTLPQTSFSRKVDIRFEDSAGNFTVRQLVAFPTSQTYTKGKITPVKINVPSDIVGYTYIEATTVDTQLGEPVTHLHLDLPEGYYFKDYSNVYAAPDVNEVHTFTMFNDLIDNTFRNTDIILSYESEHALIPVPFKFENTLTVGKRNQFYGLETPYLFYEDFNKVTTNSSQYSSTDGSMMDDAGLTGWSGSRWKSDGDRKILMLSCYVGTTMGNTNIEYGRADTPPLRNIKEGKSPKIKVVYDLGLEKHRYWELFEGGQCDIQAQLRYGTTEYDASNPVTTGGSLAIIGILGKGQGYPQSQIGMLNSSNNLVTCDFTNISGSAHGGTSYDSKNMNKDVSFTTSATNNTRITWFEDFYHTDGEPAARTIHLYLDNVRVLITK